MTILHKIWRTLTFSNKKLNGFILFVIIVLSGFIGIYSAIIPTLRKGYLNEDGALNRDSGSNLGYEESINVNIDKYGNLSVIGSFQGPQVTPNINWSLPEYKYIWALALEVGNPIARNYVYQNVIQTQSPTLSINDVYLHFYFVSEESMLTQGMEKIYFLNLNEMLQAANVLKSDFERAFGISNNFSSSPVIYERKGLYTMISFCFNYSAAVNYNYFLQYFTEHTPSGLADSFSTSIINNTPSWIDWLYSNNYQYYETVASSLRFPSADYNCSFECNVNLRYPQFFGPSYPASAYSFQLSTILDAPFTALSQLNISAFSTSEINIVVENGEITSGASPPYHIPCYMGLDHDWWLLLNASFYDTFVNGLRTVPDITVNFTARLVKLQVISPSNAIFNGTINIHAQVQTNLTSGWGSMLIAEIYDEATFKQKMFNDDSFYTASPVQATSMLFLFGGPTDFYGTWDDSYRFPNGNYFIYVYGVYTELSPLTVRARYGFGMGLVYNWSFFTLNNPNQIHLDVPFPHANDVVTKNMTILVNASSPNPIVGVQYFIYNYTHYAFYYNWGLTPMVTGTLSEVYGTYQGIWDSLTVPSTHDYVLRILVTDTNNTFFRDVPITVNNTFYQENIPIFAPMGTKATGGYDLSIGSMEFPQITDPYEGGMGGGGPTGFMFYGYGVDFGMDLTSHIYDDVIGVFITADNPTTRNPLYDLIQYGLPESDCGLTIMTLDASQPVSQIVEKAEAAFNIPSLQHVTDLVMQMGPSPIYLHMYGYNYSAINYQNFIDKFHNSVPSGLADIYTAANMTSADVTSTILFGWMDPTIFTTNPQYKNYNVGQGAYISPMIQFPNYFDSTIGTQQSVSLHQLFPQFAQFDSCSPSAASAILSGFGPNTFGLPLGAIALNSNITSWYPQDPLLVNVTPFYGYPNPYTLNLISFTLRNTLAVPYGLITTDDIRFNFTGPFITNNLLSPNKGASIELTDSNVTITSQSLIGSWDRTEYIVGGLDGRSSVANGFLSFNGNNWTDTIQSLTIPPGYYLLTTHVRDPLENWALNSTQIYINNTYCRSMLDIYITDTGDVELMGYPAQMVDLFSGGYDSHLGIDQNVYNTNDLQAVSGFIAAPGTFNQMSMGNTGENWNVLFGFQSTNPPPFPSALGQTLKADIERIFNISGLLQPLTPLITPPYSQLLYGMNFTAIQNYEYFLDFFDQQLSGNISRVFSKENLLKADQSSLLFYIFPDWFVNNLLSSMFGIPQNLDFGENIFVSPWMRFENVYNYNTLNQIHTFSLADFLNLTCLNTATESEMTYSTSTIYAHVGCGNFTGVYPNIAPYVSFTQTNLYGSSVPPTYRFQMINKQGHLIMGLNTTDDIRFNFTAPNTLINIISPKSGDSVHYNVSIIANATMVSPAYSDAQVTVCPAGAFSFGYGSIISPTIQFNITYNPIQRYWNGTWNTLDATVKNGWYDLVFTFYDALGRPQRNITRILVRNTYYSEFMTVNVDQLGNVSVSCQFQGNALVQNWNLQLPEYKKVMVTTLEAFNAYEGFHNTTKNNVLATFCSPNDIIVSVLFMPNNPISMCDQWAIPIIEDWERVFGIEGLLTHLTTIYFQLPMGAGPSGFIEVLFGANYSASITYDHFIQIFHQQLPNGMNNTIPASNIKGTDSYLMWQNMGGMYAGSGGNTPNPPNMEFAPVAQAAYLKYPQYFGTGYLTDSLSSQTLNISKLLKIPQIYHAPPSAADSLQSGIGSNMGTTGVSIQNGNITAFYPNLPGFADISNFNQYYCLLAQRNPYYSYMGGYQYQIWEQPPLNEVNVTWNEPLFRIYNIKPAPGSIVDGQTTVNMLVQNNTIFDFGTMQVTLKVFTAEEVSMLTQYEGYGLGRPAGRYGEITLTYGGQVGNALNFTGTWHAYQHPNGPIWYETSVSGSSMYGSMIYTYNTTEVTISNSNPLAVTPLSPLNGATASDLISIAAQITNSTPLQSVQCTIKDIYELQTYETFTLLDQGGGIYSIKYGTQGLPNGLYILTFSVRDIYGAIAYNAIQINVTNPKLFKLELLYPTSELDSAPQAVIIANASGPYLLKFINYKITQGFIMAGAWTTTGLTMSEGRMLDPNSLWVAYFDSSSWPSTVQPYGSYGPTYDASYQIELSGYDIRAGHALLYAQFPIGAPAVSTAEIIAPLPTLVAGLFYVWVNVTVPGDRFNSIQGEIRRSSDNQVMDSLKFTYLPNMTLAYAPVTSYSYPNQNYTLSVSGSTMTGSFSDSVQVTFANTEFLTATLTSPSGTISGIVPTTAMITHPYPLRTAWGNIYTDPEGNGVGDWVKFYHEALQNPMMDNISSFGGYSDYTPSLIEVDSSGWSYYCAYAMAIVRNGGLYFGNSTDGSTWDFSYISLGTWSQDPCLVQAFDGTLYILYDEAGSGQTRLINSTDGGLSWKGPRTIVGNSYTYPYMIQLQNGDFMIAYVNSERTLWVLTNQSSDIMTCSWNSYPIYSPMGTERMRDPAILQLSDGSFKIAISFSPYYYGGGPSTPLLISLIDMSSDLMSWSSPYNITPYRQYNSDETSPSLIEAQDGSLVLVYYGPEYGPYTNQVLILNSTDHVTWSRPSPVTWNAVESRYPSLIQCSGGDFMVAYRSSKFTGQEVFIATFDGFLDCTQWKGFIPSYTFPNGNYYIQLYAEDINYAHVQSNRLYITTNNPVIFTVNVVYPFPGAVVSGIVKVQLAVQGPYPIQSVWADIWPQGGGSSINLQDFIYNPLNGYWEQDWASWANSNGLYILQGAAHDSIGTNIWSNDITFTVSNSFTINYQVLNPLPGQTLWGTVPFIINATGPGIIKWVSWSTDRSDHNAEKYPIYQGLLGHVDPWLEYADSDAQYPSVIEIANGSFLMAYEQYGNIYLTMKLSTGWTSPYYINNGYSPCLYQRKTDGMIFLAYGRSGSYIYWASSSDNGSSWVDRGQAIGGVGPSYNNPSLTELANGTLVMAYDITSDNYDIQVAFQNGTSFSWIGAHTVLGGSSWQSNPSIICNDKGELVIAYEADIQVEWYTRHLIATALSSDNGLTFGNITVVTANCYHEWDWWLEPSLIQTAEGAYVLACQAQNSPWSDGSAIFIFNSTDRMNWGIAKPIRNDTYYFNEYYDMSSSLIQLRNGTLLVACTDAYNWYGIEFTTFQGLTEKGLWLLLVDTFETPNGYYPFNLLIEDVWHVEINFSAQWNWWRNPGMFSFGTDRTFLRDGDTLYVWFTGEPGMLNPWVDIGIASIPCLEGTPGFYEGIYTVGPTDNLSSYTPRAWLTDSYSNTNYLDLAYTITIRGTPIELIGDYIVTIPIKIDKEWYRIINGSIIILTGGSLTITDSYFDLGGHIDHPHQIYGGMLLINNSEINQYGLSYNPWFNISENGTIRLSDVFFDFNIIAWNTTIMDMQDSSLGGNTLTAYGTTAISFLRSTVDTMYLYDSASLIFEANFPLGQIGTLYAFNNSIINAWNPIGPLEDIGSIAIAGNVNAHFQTMGINFIYISFGLSWQAERSQVLIDNCLINIVVNGGVENNVTIVNEISSVGELYYSIAVNGTLTYDAGILYGTYGLDYHNGTYVYGTGTTLYIAYLYAYNAANVNLANLVGNDITYLYSSEGSLINIYNTTMYSAYIQDSTLLSNYTLFNGEVVTTNSDITVFNSVFMQPLQMQDGTRGWGLNDTGPSGPPVVSGNVMFIFPGSPIYPISGPLYISLFAKINDLNATSVEFTVNGTLQTTLWMTMGGLNVSVFYWQVAYDGYYVIGARANNSNGEQLYYEILVEVKISDSISPFVNILSPIIGSQYQEYDPIPIVVNATDNIIVQAVELWANGTYIMDLTHTVDTFWNGSWADTIGWVGFTILQIRAYDGIGNVNNTVWIWINITRFIPPEDYADLYKVSTLNATGQEQTTFHEGETVEYSATIRGDIGGNTYVVTAQTDDPLLQGYLSYNESVTVPAGQDILVAFQFAVALGAPKGTYTVQIIVWTAWPWEGGYCVDFITITFEVV